MEDETLYPGVDRTVFKLRLDTNFQPKDILNDNLIVIDSVKVVEGFGHLVKVANLEAFKHDSFLIRYSQYLHFRM